MRISDWSSDVCSSDLARAKATAELKKLKSMQPMSAEATVVRNYLDVLLGLPWGKKSKLKKDLKIAQEVLDADHFALDKVKDRIIEYLAVRSEEHTSELQSLMRISYAVFCLKKQ